MLLRYHSVDMPRCGRDTTIDILTRELQILLPESCVALPKSSSQDLGFLELLPFCLLFSR